MVFGMLFLSSRRLHTRWPRDWSSDVCSSDLRGIDRFGCDLPALCAAGGGGVAALADVAPPPAGAPGAGRCERRGGRVARREIGRASCRERGVVTVGGRVAEKTGVGLTRGDRG